jgi:hypothetical protein
MNAAIDARRDSLEPVKGLLHSGTWSSPEGNADLRRPGKELALDYFVEDRQLDFLIESNGRQSRFRFTHDGSIEPLLKLLIALQEEIDSQIFAEHIKRVIPLCESATFLASDGKRYKLTVDNLADVDTPSRGH